MSTLVLTVCVLQCAELLKQAKTKYTAKDLMGALKLYEDVLAQVTAAGNTPIPSSHTRHALITTQDAMHSSQPKMHGATQTAAPKSAPQPRYGCPAVN